MIFCFFCAPHFFLRLVLVLAEVHDLGHGRGGVRRDFDEVEAGGFGEDHGPLGVMRPMFSPSAPMRRISVARMRSLTRGPASRVGGALCVLADDGGAILRIVAGQSCSRRPGKRSRVVQIGEGRRAVGVVAIRSGFPADSSIARGSGFALASSSVYVHFLRRRRHVRRKLEREDVVHRANRIIAAIVVVLAIYFFMDAARIPPCARPLAVPSW